MRATTSAQVGAQQLVDQLDHTVTPGAGRDHVGGLLDRGQGVGDRDRATADRQEGVIVLGVADGHDIVARETELAQRRLQAAGLVDAGRQHHHRALVEGDLQLQPQLADRLQDHRLHRLPGRDDAAADRQRLDIALAQARHEGFRRRSATGVSRPVAGLVEQRAVLDHGEVAKVQFGEHPLQVGQLAPRHQHQPAARFLQAPQRSQRRLANDTVMGQRAVVVGGQRQEIHAVTAALRPL